MTDDTKKTEAESTNKPNEQVVTDWTLEQAAEVLGKSERTIRRMIQDGTLDGYKILGPQGDKWRVKPVNVSDDDRLWQVPKVKDSKIEELLKQTESLLSERDREIKQLTEKLEQSDRERAEAQVTIGFTNKQLAHLSELLHTAEESREAAIKETAELKGQVQALTSQVSYLMSKLAHDPVQQPITTSPPDMTLAAEETSHAPEEPIVSPGQSRTVKLILQVTAKNAMNCPLGTVLLARENIEKAVLSRFGMKQMSNEQGAWKSTSEYELVLSHADHPGLEKQLQDIGQQCQHEASKLKCIAKCEFKS